jgi:hypothetical protein
MLLHNKKHRIVVVKMSTKSQKAKKALESLKASEESSINAISNLQTSLEISEDTSKRAEIFLELGKAHLELSRNLNKRAEIVFEFGDPPNGGDQ